MTRKLLVISIALPFVALSLWDLSHGRYRTGVIAALLAVVNAMIYW